MVSVVQADGIYVSVHHDKGLHRNYQKRMAMSRICSLTRFTWDLRPSGSHRSGPSYQVVEGSS